MAETLVHSGPCCKSQQLHLSNLWKTAQNIFHSGKSLANDTFIQYVLLVLIRLKDLPTYTVCNLQLYRQIDIIVLRVYLQSTVQRDVKISVSELGGLGATPLISATQPGCEMAWSNRAIRSCANSVARQAHCKLALYSSALLWAFVHEQFWTAPPGTPANELQDFLWHLGQCVMWLCSSYVLKRQGSLCNLKLLAEVVGYEVSAPVTKFFHSKRAKFFPPCSAKGVIFSKHNTPAVATGQLSVLPSIRQAHTSASGTRQTTQAYFTRCCELLGDLALHDTVP